MAARTAPPAMGAHRRPLLLAALVALAVCAPPAAAHRAGTSQAPLRPNVIVLETDDQTDASLRYMYETRRLLADQGTTFTRSFVSFPLCCPSRATLFTGQYAHNHGVIHNRPPSGGYTKLDKTNWLPGWLQSAGYHTIQVGRTLNGYGVDNLNANEVPPGYDEWYVPLDPTTFDYLSFTLNENGELVSYPQEGEGPEYQTDLYNRMVVDLIERNAGSSRPFFLYVGYSAPHSGRPRDPDDPPGLATPAPAPRHRDVFAGLPLPTPPSFNEANVSDKPREVADLPRLSSERIAAIRENYQQRLESLLAVDEGVEEMYDALVRSGELDNTLIVFTSDNGFFHGEHRIAAGKAYPYEAALRVPLVLRGPGVPHGRSLPQIVANIDLAPTILEAAGALPGRVQDGISLFTLMRDPGRELGRDLLLENGHGAGGVGALKAIRTYRYFYAEHRTTGEHELYDLARDPWELRNLDHDAGYDGVERELARRLHRLQHCRGAGCRARPRLHLLVHLGARHARGGRCPSGKVRVRVGGADRRRLVRADFLVGQRRIARRAHGPFASTLPLAGGPRRVRLRVRAVLRDGRVLTLDRRLVACRG